jgi:predicted metal-dependent hydrolase
MSLRSGAALFDRGEFWEAHECWEELWRRCDAPERDYLKGLIQFAAVNYHLLRGNRAGARRLLDTGARHLSQSSAEAWPFDTGHLLAVAAVMAAKLDAGRMVAPTQLRLEPMLGLVAARAAG